MSLEASERGPEVSYQLALLITGVALAYWVDLGFVQGLDKSPDLWRIPLAMQSCFAIFSACLMFMLPDTPRWVSVPPSHPTCPRMAEAAVCGNEIART